MNTVWTFGDSFTNCVGLTHIQDGFKLKKRYLPMDWFGEEYYKYAWFNLIGNLLNNRVENFSRGGASTEHILKWLILNLKNIKPGDTVIIGETFPTRLRILNNKKEFTHFVLNGTKYIEETSLSNDQYNACVDYLYYVREPFNDEYELDSRENFESICTHLNSLGVKTIIWSYRCWPYFDSWKYWSRGVIKDPHYSLNGNIDFANTLYYLLTKVMPDNKVDHFNLDIHEQDIRMLDILAKDYTDPGILPDRVDCSPAILNNIIQCLEGDTTINLDISKFKNYKTLL